MIVCSLIPVRVLELFLQSLTHRLQTAATPLCSCEISFCTMVYHLAALCSRALPSVLLCHSSVPSSQFVLPTLGVLSLWIWIDVTTSFLYLHRFLGWSLACLEVREKTLSFGYMKMHNTLLFLPQCLIYKISLKISHLHSIRECVRILEDPFLQTLLATQDAELQL
jgi:hypothetical protein